MDDGLLGSGPYQMPEDLVLEPAAFGLFYGRITGIALEDVGDAVRLLDPNGNVVETVAFGELAPGASYSRDEDGIWHDDWSPSPGAPNASVGPVSRMGVGRIDLRPAAVGSQRLGMGKISLWIR